MDVSDGRVWPCFRWWSSASRLCCWRTLTLCSRRSDGRVWPCFRWWSSASRLCCWRTLALCSRRWWPPPTPPPAPPPTLSLRRPTQMALPPTAAVRRNRRQTAPLTRSDALTACLGPVWAVSGPPRCLRVRQTAVTPAGTVQQQYWGSGHAQCQTVRGRGTRRCRHAVSVCSLLISVGHGGCGALDLCRKAAFRRV